MLYYPTLDAQIKDEMPDFGLLSEKYKDLIMRSVLRGRGMNYGGWWRGDKETGHADRYAILESGSTVSVLTGYDGDYPTFYRAVIAAAAFEREVWNTLRSPILRAVEESITPQRVESQEGQPCS